MNEQNSKIVAGPTPSLTPEFVHELRTPLNQIIGYSELLAEQAEEEGRSELAQDLQKIRSGGRKLLDMLSGTIPDASSSQLDSVVAAPEPRDGKAESRGSREPAGGNAAAGIEDLEPGVILVVDDIEVNRDVLSRRIERQGYSVATAANGFEALEAVRNKAFDLVLLDIMMPELDGYSVLQQMKADPALQSIPVIMISALHEMESVVRCIELGAEDYLCKPFEPPILKARIDSCLEKKRSRDNELRLYQQLQENYARLQGLEKLRDDLTHMIVHDLRTPLTSVMAGMQTLEVVGNLDDIQKEMVEISVRGGETLLGMINDLLEVDKMESGAMELEYSTVNALELVTIALAQVASLADREELTVHSQFAENLPLIRVDEEKLRRILVNLLGNAIKFTPAGGTVTVKVGFGADADHLQFCITDTGEGIPPEDVDNIFEKFGQVKTRQAGRTLSTGLGLTFCKLAVEAHGGQIRVVSQPGRGSTFSFSIPIDC